MLDIGYILDGKYEVIRVLGQGGMGTVYLCKNIRLDNLWAIKEMKKDHKVNIDILSEANILKQLNHPGIPKIIDIFYEKDYLYMVEDYINGQTLYEYIRENSFIELENMKHILLNICDIIGYLHSFSPSIIYRDLKPSNIMITPEGKVFLIDFGISKIYKVEKDSDTIFMGSNGYAAPEQRGLVQSCVQTDIYGIGMVMYFMVTGKASSNETEPLMDESYDKDVNINIKRIIQKCVQIDIKDRYGSVEELRNEIMGLLNEGMDKKTLLLYKVDKKPRKSGKYARLKKSILVLPVIIAVILAIVYSLNSSEKKDIDPSTINKPKVDSTTISLPAEKNENNNQAAGDTEQTTETTKQNLNENNNQSNSIGLGNQPENSNITNVQNETGKQTYNNQYKSKAHSKKKK
ncbi:MAG: serine/threonine-protein kinase [Bacillota bacterium]|nr:serine/threonine-protein kinase [Bacillota bacterium]